MIRLQQTLPAFAGIPPVCKGGLPDSPCCAVCDARESKESWQRCSRCKVIFYCSKKHQIQHRPAHKTVCNTIAQANKAYDEAAALLHQPHDSEVWSTDGGNLLPPTLYLQSMDKLCAWLGLVDPPSRASVQQQLDCVMHIDQLKDGYKLDTRSMIAPLFLRLGKDAECYTYLSWLDEALVDPGLDSGEYLESTMRQKGAGAFDDFMAVYDEEDSYPPIDISVPMIMLKSRLMLDVLRVDCTLEGLQDRLPSELLNQICALIPHSPIVAAKRTMFTPAGRKELLKLGDQLFVDIIELAEAVDKDNSLFWDMLLQPQPDGFDLCHQKLGGTCESIQATRMLRHTWAAWHEIPGILDYVKMLHEGGKITSDQFW